MPFLENEKVKRATLELEPAVSLGATWMAPSDQRNFIGLATVQALALLLMSAFLAGIQEQAVSEAKDSGKSVTKWLSAQIRQLFEGESPQLESVEADAEAGAAAYSEDKANTAEAMVVSVLVTMMPETDAKSLAQSVRVSVEANVIKE